MKEKHKEFIQNDKNEMMKRLLEITKKELQNQEYLQSNLPATIEFLDVMKNIVKSFENLLYKESATLALKYNSDALKTIHLLIAMPIVFDILKDKFMKLTQALSEEDTDVLTKIVEDIFGEKYMERDE